VSDDARQILNEADRHRRQADAADLARTKIRLGEKPSMSRGILGFRTEGHTELVFTADETHALYEALIVLRGAHLADAERLEAKLRVERGEQQ
jgi:hypothetical protein